MEFWRKLDDETERRRRVVTPPYVAARIMASLPETRSATVMATLIGGGTVSFWGPVVGALVFIVARDMLGALTETWLLWYGLLFMVVVLFQPEGIAGAWETYVGRFFRRPTTLSRWSG